MALELTAKPINRFIIAAFTVPLLLLAVAAWRDHVQLERSAQQQAARTAIALAEHATRVLEEQNGALLQLEERIAGLSDDKVHGSRELHEWLTVNLPKYMIPRYLEFRDEFPKTPSERIEKYKLQADPLDRPAVFDAEQGRAARP